MILVAREKSFVTKWILMMAFLPFGCAAQTGNIDPTARKGIDAGNQAWITGMKAGNAAIIAASYGENALDCPATGECVRGRAGIAQHLKERSAKLGKAVSATVTSIGSVQQGTFVYEWGRADATFGDGQKLGGRYLTVWHKQPTGDWKIFRNLAIPADNEH
jgi:ketosteroid isomerase-like protein